jgi:Protein of unknown function (DUF4230)
MGSTGTTTRPLEQRDVPDTVELPTERAGTLAPVEAPVETPPAPPAQRRVVPRTVWFFAIIALLGVSGAVGLGVVIRALGDANPFKNGLVTQRTVDRSGPAVLKAVSELGTLQSASGHYEMIVDIEHSVDHVPSFLAGRRVLFVAVGDVGTTVNLRDLPAGSVTVDDARTSATIHLAKPQISAPHLDLAASHVYSSDRGVVDAIGDLFNGSPDQQQQIYATATQKLAQAARADDELVNRAEASTRTTLQGLLRPLGFTDVTVVFDR